MKINIAYIIPSLNVGGSEKKVIDLSSRLDKDKFNPIIITITKNGDLLPQAETANIPVFCAHKMSKFDFGVVKRISKILKENKIDIVQVFTSTGKLWGRLAAIKAKTKVIISTEESIFRNKFIDRFLERRLSKKTDLIIANSLATLYYATTATNIKESKYCFIHNGINLDPFINAESKGIIPKEKDQVILMSVSRLDPRKRIDLLISALYDIQIYVDVKLVIVGSGPEEEKLRIYVNELELEDKVIFLGTRGDVPSLLKEADVFVLPSDEEGFGNVIIEAMAAKVCVVASDAGGIPEIIENFRNGIIFKRGNFERFKESLLLVLQDKNLRDGITSNAFDNIEYYSRQRMVEEHEREYLKLIESRNKK